MNETQVELKEEFEAGSLWNKDLKSVPVSERTWNKWHYAALWVSMSVSITTYMLGASLIDSGMNWWQAVFTVMLGNMIVLIPMLLIAHAGVKYGIPFPVLLRSSFGIHGAKLAAMFRGLVACGWFGIQTFIGGNAIYLLCSIIFPEILNTKYLGDFIGLNIGQLVSFSIFWAVQVIIVYRGIECIKHFETFIAPFLIIFGIALLIWAWNEVGSFSKILEASYQISKRTNTNFWVIFWPGLTAVVGYWATLALNIPDFTRFSKSQKEQIIGQVMGMPTTMTLFSFIGIVVTSATVLLYGKAL